MHDERTRLAQDVERELRQHFPEMVFETVIPRSVRVAEAPSYGLPVTEHSPNSRGSDAYRALAEELVAAWLRPPGAASAAASRRSCRRPSSRRPASCASCRSS